jgi:two-component sensor histidine kinase
MSEITGYDRTEVEGRPFLDFVHPDDRATLIERYIKTSKGSGFRGPTITGYSTNRARSVFVTVKGTAIELKGKTGHALFYFRHHRAEAREELLKTSLAEKEILLKEIHHRVKNKHAGHIEPDELQVDALNDPAVPRRFGRARTASRPWRSSTSTFTGRRTFRRSISRSMRSPGPHNHEHLSAGRVKTEVSVRNVHLDIDRAIPCGLIINELVTNCVKHAFPGGRGGRIDVLMNGTEEGRYELVVADDGVGGCEDGCSTSSLGMRLIKSLVTQLKGRIWIESTAGTRIRILF